jgi:hypothetical protein
MKTCPLTLVALALIAAPAFAQESQFAADLRREREQVAESCGEFAPKALAGCGYTLATATPFHMALGSLAPQNGFTFGLAFAEHYTPNESWRISWNADAVGTPSGSWRGGVFMKLVHTPATAGVVVRQPGSPSPATAIAPREFAVVDIVAQTISLKTLNYFGPGQQSLESGRSVFGEQQTLVGASAIYPLSGVPGIGVLHPALVGGVTGRFVTIRPGSSDKAPSIEQVYTDATAPGLSEQDPFVEFREGLRIKPSVAQGWLQFDYLVSAQQFRTSDETRSSFTRWTVDLQHEIPLYRRVSSTGPRAFNGPNECAQASGSSACPPVQWSRNREGSIGFRIFLTGSSVSNGDQVPFYFQPTLGGSDINGDQRLASYQDYRFRGPNLIMLQERLEHALWGPFGVYLLAEQGKVSADPGDLNLSDLVASTTVGLTLRAGGFPMVNLSFSWGGEGHHVIGSMNATLLGGSARPSLY